MSAALAIGALIGAFASTTWKDVVLVAILAALAAMFHFFPN